MTRYEDPAEGQLSADEQPRLRPVPRDLDYGEGKSREQEAHDSRVMLALVLLNSAVVLVGVIGVVIVLLWLT